MLQAFAPRILALHGRSLDPHDGSTERVLVHLDHHHHLGQSNLLDLVRSSYNPAGLHPGSSCVLACPVAPPVTARPDVGGANGGTEPHRLCDPDLRQLGLRSPGRLVPPHPAYHRSPCTNWVSDHCPPPELRLKGGQPGTRVSVCPSHPPDVPSDLPFIFSVLFIPSFDKPDPKC